MRSPSHAVAQIAQHSRASQRSSSPDFDDESDMDSGITSPMSPRSGSPISSADALSLVEARLELEKLRESAAMQEQELRDEISTVLVIYFKPQSSSCRKRWSK